MATLQPWRGIVLMNSSVCNYTVSSYEYLNLLSFEANFDPVSQLRWFNRNFYWGFFVVGSVYAFVYLLRCFMEKRKGLELKAVSVSWFLSLAIFYLSASFRLMPHLFFDLRRHGFLYTFCDFTYLQNRVVTAWLMLYIASKLAVLMDSVLLVLRKRPIPFLHVYHHVSMALAALYFGPPMTGARWIVVVNSLEAVMMYVYFALKCLGIRFGLRIRVAIRVIQILQMLYGVAVVVLLMQLKLRGLECCFTWKHIGSGGLLLVTFIFLYTRCFNHTFRQTKKKIQ